jgi:hypothetical protein
MGDELLVELVKAGFPRRRWRLIGVDAIGTRAPSRGGHLECQYGS